VVVCSDWFRWHPHPPFTL